MGPLHAMLAALVAAVVLQGEVGAVLATPTPKDVERAQKLAQAKEPVRAQFHAPYIFHLDDAVVEQIEVITEYRRYVLATEEQLRMGNWLFAQSPERAQEKVKPWRGRVTLSARLRFHPQNTLIGIPPYEIALGGLDVPPLDVTRTPIHAPLSGRRGDVSAPLVGTIVDAVFSTPAVGETARPVVVSLRGERVASVTIDFARLE